MPWLRAGVGVLALLWMTGCPSEFGMDGRIDKAAHKDATELVIPRCTAQQREKFCGGGKAKSPECLEECGG